VVLGAIGALASLVYGGVTLAVVALSALWVLRLVVVHRGGLDRLGPAQETTLLLAILLVVYLGNARTLGGGDTLPARYLPLALLRQQTFRLDGFPVLHATCAPYYLAHVGGHYVSVYPVGPALLALPVFLPAALAGVPADGPVVAELEKLAAAIMVALSAVLLYRAISRIARRRLALLATAAYALGSSSFSVSSQALWQHGPSQLGLAATLYCLLRGRDQPSWVAWAGLPLSFATITRPTDALIAVGIAAYVLWCRPRQLPGFALCAAPPLVFQLWYAARYFGDPFRTQWNPLDVGRWSTPLWEGLAGLMLSPGRGLLVYSPIFALSLLGFALAWRRGGDPLLRVLGVASCVLIVLYAKWEMWWGGFTVGPRLLADLTPALALGLVPLEGLLERHRGLALAAAVLLGWSIAAHAVGTYAHDQAWNTYADVDRHPARLWSFTDNQLVNPFRRTLARARLLLSGVPTSGSAPELLAASYAASLAPPRQVPASSPLELSVAVVNEGRAAWLAWPVDSDGIMKLRWRWRRPEGGTTVAAGVRPLYRDVAPGRSRDFKLRLDPPPPGSYRLELGLVRNGPACASPIGSPELRLDVTVTGSDTPADAAMPARRCPSGSLDAGPPPPCRSVPSP
jgi:hypothetical protein